VIERGRCVRGDRGDGVANSSRLPRLIDQGLELRRVVEDRVSLIAVQVGVEPVCELVRTAERDAVAGVDLVGCDAQTIVHHPAQEVGWKESVLAAQQKARRNVRPSLERPRLSARCVRLPPTAPQRLGRQGRRDVVVERRRVVARPFAVYRLVARVGPPVVSRLARLGDEAGYEHEQLDRHAFAHDRCDEAPGRLRDDDELRAVADRVNDSVRVVAQSG
jgi:hypothetical protein